MKNKLLACFVVLLLFLSINPIHATELKEIELVNAVSNFIVVAELEDNQTNILYQKNGDSKMYPASMTKMLTVYTAILGIDNPDDLVTVEYSDVAGLVEQEASVANLEVGKQYTLKEVLLGSMLPSGADATNVLARITAGDIPSFVNKMNETAKSLGMNHSHFVNTSGLYDDNHYTTVNDLLKLMQAALKNQLFKEVFTTLNYQSQDTQLHPNGLSFQSTMLRYALGDESKIGYIQGGKTGWVPESGYCLASYTDFKGKDFVIITGEAFNSGDQLSDHNLFYKFLFENTHEVEILKANEVVGQVKLVYQKPNQYDIINQESVNLSLPLIINQEDLVYENDFISTAITPVPKDSEIGNLNVKLGNEVIYQAHFSFDKKIERNEFIYLIDKLLSFFKSDFFSLFLKILALLFILLISTLFILRKRNINRRRREGRKGYRL